MSVELTWFRLGKILWSYVWRSTLYLMISAIFLVVPLVYLGSQLHRFFYNGLSHYPLVAENISFFFQGVTAVALEDLFWFVLTAPLLWLAFRRVVDVEYADFKFHTENASEKFKRVQASFWWGWYWRTGLIAAVINVLMFSLNEYVLNMPAYTFAIVSGVLLFVLTIVIDLVILKKLFRKDYGDFGLSLVGLPIESSSANK